MPHHDPLVCIAYFTCRTTGLKAAASALAERSDVSDRDDNSAVAQQLEPTAGIFIRDLEKVFDTGATTLRAIDNISLTVAEGEFLCIVGPSGCGKTTLLRILGGLELPSRGEVEISIRHEGRPVQSMVFQEQGVFPWLSALDNAAFGLQARGVPKAERTERAQAMLEKLGLAGFENTYPRQLSGGMRQRVNLARAFANDPAILLMDEPLGALDEQTKMLVQDDLLKLWEESRKTVLFITHSLDEAVTLGDRVAVMSHRPGRIKAQFDVNLPRPRNALEIRNNPDFIEVRRKVWEALRDEVLHARDAPDD